MSDGKEDHSVELEETLIENGWVCTYLCFAEILFLGRSLAEGIVSDNSKLQSRKATPDGMEFFVNEKTKAISWTRPQALAVTKEENPKVSVNPSPSHAPPAAPPMAVTAAGTDAQVGKGAVPQFDRKKRWSNVLDPSSELLSPEEIAKLPLFGGWEKSFDAASRKHYFVNLDNGKTQWDHPLLVRARNEASPLPLPAEWRTNRDSNGKLYFFKQTSSSDSITSWENPNVKSVLFLILDGSDFSDSSSVAAGVLREQQDLAMASLPTRTGGESHRPGGSSAAVSSASSYYRKHDHSKHDQPASGPPTSSDSPSDAGTGRGVVSPPVNSSSSLSLQALAQAEATIKKTQDRTPVSRQSISYKEHLRELKEQARQDERNRLAIYRDEKLGPLTGGSHVDLPASGEASFTVDALPIEVASRPLTAKDLEVSLPAKPQSPSKTAGVVEVSELALQTPGEHKPAIGEEKPPSSSSSSSFVAATSGAEAGTVKLNHPRSTAFMKVSLLSLKDCLIDEITQVRKQRKLETKIHGPFCEDLYRFLSGKRMEVNIPDEFEAVATKRVVYENWSAPAIVDSILENPFVFREFSQESQCDPHFALNVYVDEVGSAVSITVLMAFCWRNRDQMNVVELRRMRAAMREESGTPLLPVTFSNLDEVVMEVLKSHYQEIRARIDWPPALRLYLFNAEGEMDTSDGLVPQRSEAQHDKSVKLLPGYSKQDVMFLTFADEPAEYIAAAIAYAPFFRSMETMRGMQEGSAAVIHVPRPTDNGVVHDIRCALQWRPVGDQEKLPDPGEKSVRAFEKKQRPAAQKQADDFLSMYDDDVDVGTQRQSPSPEETSISADFAQFAAPVHSEREKFDFTLDFEEAGPREEKFSEKFAIESPSYTQAKLEAKSSLQNDLIDELNEDHSPTFWNSRKSAEGANEAGSGNGDSFNHNRTIDSRERVDEAPSFSERVFESSRTEDEVKTDLFSSMEKMRQKLATLSAAYGRKEVAREVNGTFYSDQPTHSTLRDEHIRPDSQSPPVEADRASWQPTSLMESQSVPDTSAPVHSRIVPESNDENVNSNKTHHQNEDDEAESIVRDREGTPLDFTTTSYLSLLGNLQAQFESCHLHETSFPTFSELERLKAEMKESNHLNHTLKLEVKDLRWKVDHTAGMAGVGLPQEDGFSLSDEESKVPSSFSSNRRLFEQFISLFRTHPAYVCNIGFSLGTEDVRLFCSILIRSIYDYNSVDDSLLLSVLEVVLYRAEEITPIKYLKSPWDILLQNPLLLHFCRAYFERDDVSVYLEETLGSWLRSISRDMHLNLDLDPAHLEEEAGSAPHLTSHTVPVESLLRERLSQLDAVLRSLIVSITKESAIQELPGLLSRFIVVLCGQADKLFGAGANVEMFHILFIHSCVIPFLQRKSRALLHRSKMLGVKSAEAVSRNFECNIRTVVSALRITCVSLPAHSLSVNDLPWHETAWGAGSTEDLRLLTLIPFMRNTMNRCQESLETLRMYCSKKAEQPDNFRKPAEMSELVAISLGELSFMHRVALETGMAIHVKQKNELATVLHAMGSPLEVTSRAKDAFLVLWIRNPKSDASVEEDAPVYGALSKLVHDVRSILSEDGAEIVSAKTERVQHLNSLLGRWRGHICRYVGQYDSLRAGLLLCQQYRQFLEETKLHVLQELQEKRIDALSTQDPGQIGASLRNGNTPRGSLPTLFPVARKQPAPTTPLQMQKSKMEAAVTSPAAAAEWERKRGEKMPYSPLRNSEYGPMSAADAASAPVTAKLTGKHSLYAATGVSVALPPPSKAGSGWQQPKRVSESLSQSRSAAVVGEEDFPQSPLARLMHTKYKVSL
jgi:hypothetical protein